MPLRVGVLGVGAMGENHVRNWAKIQEETGLARLVGVYDQNQERAGSVVAKHGTDTFRNLNWMAEAVKIRHRVIMDGRFIVPVSVREWGIILIRLDGY